MWQIYEGNFVYRIGAFKDTLQLMIPHLSKWSCEAKHYDRVMHVGHVWIIPGKARLHQLVTQSHLMNLWCRWSLEQLTEFRFRRRRSWKPNGSEIRQRNDILNWKIFLNYFTIVFLRLERFSLCKNQPDVRTREDLLKRWRMQSPLAYKCVGRWWRLNLKRTGASWTCLDKSIRKRHSGPWTYASLRQHL